MSKRRGFTLTEIVVVIALTSLVLAMVGGCLYFVSTYSGTLISKSEELTKVQTIETYLRGQVKLDNGYISEGTCEKLRGLKIDNGNLVNQDGDTVIKNANLKTMEFEIIFNENENKGFLQCTLVFQSGNDYTFILGIVQK